MTQRQVSKRDWGQLGVAMKALPSDRHRAFVEHYLLLAPERGAQTEAARRAGFGRGSTSLNQARIASHLMRNPKIIAALAEAARQVIRVGGFEASKALMALIADPTHKDHGRAISMVLARTDPELALHDVNVTHRVVDEDQESLEELRALRALGTGREKLLELFGGNGLSRLERLEAADMAKRADSAKLINAAEDMVDDQR